MMKLQLISLRDANQNFSRLVAAVERGEAFCITRRGAEVARLTPSPVLEAGGALSDAQHQDFSNPDTLHVTTAAVPTLETSLGERVRQLEARLDKISAALSPTNE